MMENCIHLFGQGSETSRRPNAILKREALDGTAQCRAQRCRNHSRASCRWDARGWLLLRVLVIVGCADNALYRYYHHIHFLHLLRRTTWCLAHP